MKTILHISKYYYPDLGGIENVAQQLAEGLTEYHNVVICFSHDKQTHYDKVDNIDVIRVGVSVVVLYTHSQGLQHPCTCPFTTPLPLSQP